MIALLAMLISVGGCSVQEAKLEEAQLTITKLETEVLALKRENASLRAHEEMAIGEVAFAQGCALWINLCFGKDAIGRQLIAQGLSAQGSWQHFLWVSFKLLGLPLALVFSAASVVRLTHFWILPSAQALENARSVLARASHTQAELEKTKIANLEEVQLAASIADQEATRAKQRLAKVNRAIAAKEDESKNLEEQIERQRDELVALEIAQSAAKSQRR